jgi:hypothetical protein
VSVEFGSNASSVGLVLRGPAAVKISEFQIQQAVCIWLDGNLDPKTGIPRTTPALKSDAIYWHTPNGGSRNAIEGARLKQTGVKAGIFDLTFLRAGRLFALELKDDKGVLSPAQRIMWPRYEAAGAAGIAVANSLVAAKAQIFSWGLTLFP